MSKATMQANLFTIIVTELTAATSRRDYFTAKRRAARLAINEQYAIVDAFIAARHRIFGVERPHCRCFACRNARSTPVTTRLAVVR